MALKQCRECGRDVSSSARQCPHCGVSSPGGWFTYQGVGGGGCLKALGCLVLLGIALWMFGLCPMMLAV